MAPFLSQVPPASPQHHQTHPQQQHYPISFQEIESLRRQNAALLETILYENNRMYYHHQSPSPIRVTLSHPALAPYIYPATYHTHHQQSLVMGNSSLTTPTPQSSPCMMSHQDDLFATNFTRAGEAIIRPIEQELEGYNEQGDPQGGVSNKLAPPKLSVIGRKTSADEFGSTSSCNKSILSRSVSEKVGHRSELMSQVQRTAWARHTTK